MDSTLSAILTALYQAHATIDAQQRQLTEAAQRIVALEAQVAAPLLLELPPGWRLVKDA